MHISSIEGTFIYCTYGNSKINLSYCKTIIWEYPTWHKYTHTVFTLKVALCIIFSIANCLWDQKYSVLVNTHKYCNPLSYWIIRCSLTSHVLFTYIILVPITRNCLVGLTSDFDYFTIFRIVVYHDCLYGHYDQLTKMDLILSSNSKALSHVINNLVVFSTCTQSHIQ